MSETALLFILWVTMPSGREIPTYEFSDKIVCDAMAAKERMAMMYVAQKDKRMPALKFICRPAAVEIVPE